MCPAYLNLAAPVVLMRHVPAMLWFAHPSVTPALRLADRLATVILTSLPGSYPLPGPKVRVIGQAVNLESFPPTPPAEGGPLRLVAIGRTSPAKGFPTIVRAAAAARASGVDAELRLIGPSTTPEERRHRVELDKLVHETLGPAGSLEAAVPHEGVTSAIAEADVLVNAMVAGSGDKVVFEAAAMQRPVLVSNPAFAGLLAGLPLELRFPAGDHRALAARIADLAAAEPAAREAVGHELRARVARDHSLSHWADAVAAVVGGCP
jgi:glycosyltransferase involved in cell wall biosynthesis